MTSIRIPREERNKWDFALEEAVKELEEEFKKQNNKSKSPNILRRIALKMKSSSKAKQQQQQQQQQQEQTQQQQSESGQIGQQQHDQQQSCQKNSENKNNNNGAISSETEAEVTEELKNSSKSPIMSGNNSTAVVRTRGSQRKQGVAERNEIERRVVYRTLKNYNQINKLRDYDLM